MKSVKPGRGPSAMGAVGSVAVGIFGIIWTISAAGMGAPAPFVLFGFVFVGLAIAQGIFHYKNATGENRMSLFDITDSQAEPDPLEKFIKKSTGETQRSEKNSTSTLAFEDSSSESSYSFCPFCGTKLGNHTYRFCPKCGKEVGKS